MRINFNLSIIVLGSIIIKKMIDPPLKSFLYFKNLYYFAILFTFYIDLTPLQNIRFYVNISDSRNKIVNRGFQNGRK